MTTPSRRYSAATADVGVDDAARIASEATNRTRFKEKRLVLLRQKKEVPGTSRPLPSFRRAPYFFCCRRNIFSVFAAAFSASLAACSALATAAWAVAAFSPARHRHVQA